MTDAIPKILLLAAVLFNADAQAQMEALHYRAGNVEFVEKVDQIVIQSDPPITVSVLPGGRAWPPLQIDESGRIFAGNVIDSTTGKHITLRSMKSGAIGESVHLAGGLEVISTGAGYELRRGRRECSISYNALGGPRGRSPAEALREANVKLAATEDKALALVTSFLNDGATANYRVYAIDLRTCKVNEVANLGDPDLLVELGKSRHGGWWITGSIEQTLMISKNGTMWRTVKLPEGLSSLVSSYVVDDQQIWLAGILDNSEEYPNLLIYSPDGGTQWINLKKNDPLLAKIPVGWLEGQKRKAFR